MRNLMKKAVVIAMALLCAFGIIFTNVADTIGAGITQEKPYYNHTDQTVVLEVTWTANTGGDVTEAQISGLTGYYLWMIMTDPSGVTAPTDNYDIYLYDIEHGNDVLGGAGLNRDTSTTETSIICLDSANGIFGSYYMWPDKGSGVTMQVLNNAVSGASGIVIFYGYK